MSVLLMPPAFAVDAEATNLTERLQSILPTSAGLRSSAAGRCIPAERRSAMRWFVDRWWKRGRRGQLGTFLGAFVSGQKPSAFSPLPEARLTAILEAPLCLGANDSLRPCFGDIPKWPPLCGLVANSAR